MKKIELKNIGEEVFYERLENGLDVYLYNKDGCTNNYVTFTTKFGSIHNEFVPIGENNMLKVPNGVAHFLEHKVFVQEVDPQPEDFFSKSGAVCNAYTTLKNTTYLFSGPNNLKENIAFLLDYVQKPYFTEENVESEKGIIAQEINMCDDNPTDVLYEYIRKNSFHNNSFKESIIGTIDDINKITPDVLYKCYNTFYHPKNMFLVVTGNFDVNDVLNSIVANQVSKKFEQFDGVDIKEYDEPDTVVKVKDMIMINTTISKLAYNIKISLKNINMSIKKYNLYLFIIFSILFDDTSLFDEEAKDEGIITSSLSLNILNCDSHLLISLINETNCYDKLIEKIEMALKNIVISVADLERKKRVLISNELFSFENIEIVGEMIIDNIIFENTIETDMIEILKSLNIEELNSVIENLNLDNKSIVILQNK